MNHISKFLTIMLIVPNLMCSVMAAESVSSLCSLCICDRGSVPYFVDCSGLEINSTMWITDRLEIGAKEAIMLDLDLTGNNIENVGSLANLPIHMLSLRGNYISAIEPLTNLTFLSYLDLSYNRLEMSAFDSRTFLALESQNSSLIELDLSHNQLDSLPKDVLQHLQHLQVLKMNGNPIKTVEKNLIDAFATLKRLQTLGLSQCGLQDLPDNFAASLKELKHLDLSGNHFVNVPQEVRNLGSLEYLNLNNNGLKYITFSSFVGLDQLQYLSLGFMETLEQIESGAFSPLGSLNTLLVHYNTNLYFLSPDAFEQWPKAENFTLNELVLAGNDLTYLDQRLLGDKENWKRLKHIDISANPWICDCHNEWLMSELTTLNTLTHVAETTCGPDDPDLAGVSLIMVDAHVLQCDHNQNFNPYKPQNRQKLQQSTNSRRKDRLSLALVLLCISAIVVTVGFVFGLQARAERRRVYNDAVRFTASHQGNFQRPRRPGAVY